MFRVLFSGPAIRVLALALVSFTAEATSLVGGHTIIDLDAATVHELTSLGFSIAPIAPGTLNGLVASFPITNATATMIDTSGGLDLNINNSPANLQDFLVDFQTGTVSGLFTAYGVYLSGVDFFDLARNGMSYNVTLDSQLAGILERAYGVPNLTGTTIGRATVVPAPEPESLTLIACGLFVGLALSRKSVRLRKQL